MVDRFIEHIRTKKLLDENRCYILAISGGMDSVCLGHLLLATGYNFVLAHMNFGLRGLESDGDEAFVRDLAIQWGKDIFVKKVLSELFEQGGQSTQMTARQLRYEWFDQLLTENKYAGVLLGHHLDDQLETILLNLLRGTGIEGIYGMADKRSTILRPLLPFKRSELKQFMVDNNYIWRDDSSNKKNIYKRNFLRNEIVPTIQRGFENGLDQLSYSFERIKDSGKAFFYLYQQWKASHIIVDSDQQRLQIDSIKNLPGKTTFLFYWLRDFGFQSSDMQGIIHALDSGESGKSFLSSSHMLLLDRKELLVSAIVPEWKQILVEKSAIEFSYPYGRYDILKYDDQVQLDRDPENAMLDFDKMAFPLTLRPWKEGDRFFPLGMKNSKLVSDYFIDSKISILGKKRAAVLLSGKEIAWVVGYRISDKFKCDDNTRRIVYFVKKQANA